jgi:hypothetical protein
MHTRLRQFGAHLALCLLLLLTACYPGYDPRAVAPTPTATRPSRFPTQAAQTPIAPVRFAAQPIPTLTSEFQYLPLYAQGKAHYAGAPLALSLRGQPLQLLLSALKEPSSASVSEPGVRAFISTMVITNTGSAELELPLRELFQGMNGSGKPLDKGGQLRLEQTEATLRLPAKGARTLDLLWRTEVYGADMRLWITFNLPIQESGYIQPSTESAIWTFSLSAIGQTQADACERAAKFVRETVEDDTIFKPGEHFTKTWVIENSGKCDWIEGSTWAYFSGEAMGVTQPLPLLDLPAPGGQLTITVPMTAPLKPGSYRGEWRLRAPWGEFYNRAFYLQIVVK